MAMYLRTVRERRGWTQMQLAKASGIAQNSISKLERYAHKRPVYATVIALAQALSVSPENLRFGPDPRRRQRPIDGRRRSVPGGVTARVPA
jgi:transcriptional regulator with XRE-family HTH domain